VNFVLDAKRRLSAQAVDRHERPVRDVLPRSDAPGLGRTIAGTAMRALQVTIDGEAVVSDQSGVTDFYALRSVLSRWQGGPGIFLYAFDLCRGGDLGVR
jgi:hypothetical protein